MQKEMSATPTTSSSVLWQWEHRHRPKHSLQTSMLCELLQLSLLKACTRYHSSHSVGILSNSQVQPEAQNVWKLHGALVGWKDIEVPLADTHQMGTLRGMLTMDR
jgi:hypothetical protein